MTGEAHQDMSMCRDHTRKVAGEGGSRTPGSPFLHLIQSNRRVQKEMEGWVEEPQDACWSSPGLRDIA